MNTKIYLYTERERERKREILSHVHTYIHINKYRLTHSELYGSFPFYG